MIKEFTINIQCVASIDARHTPATRIKIDTEALGINWAQGETYRIEVIEGAYTEIANNRYPTPLIEDSFSFTTNADGANIVETSPRNERDVPITVVGAAQKSTTQVKFGTASLSPSSGGLEAATGLPTTGDFTVEYWGYITNRSAILGHWGVVAGAHKITVESTTSPTGPVRLVITDAAGTNVINTTSTGLGDNQFRHVSLVRSGSNFTVYLDGTAIINETSSVELPSLQTLQVGKVGSNSFRGLIDEFRVSNIARYTSSFTPPSGPFVNDANTLLLLHMDGANGATDFDDDGTGTQTVTNNRWVDLYFNRAIEFNTTGSIVLREVGGATVKTYTNTSANWTITDRHLRLELDYGLDITTSYELEVVGNPILDVDGFIADETGVVLAFTTYEGPTLNDLTPINGRNIRPRDSFQLPFVQMPNGNVQWATDDANKFELVETPIAGTPTVVATYSNTSNNWNFDLPYLLSLDTTGLLTVGNSYELIKTQSPILDSQQFRWNPPSNTIFEYTVYKAPELVANPVNLLTDVNDDVFITVEYDEPISAITGGTYDLYKNGVFELTFNVDDPLDATFDGNTLKLHATGLLDNSADYYLMVDYGQIQNAANVPNFAVDDTTTLAFETVYSELAASQDYVIRNKNYIFASDTPVLHNYEDESTTDTFFVKLTVPAGHITDNDTILIDDVADYKSITLSGTKDQVNALLVDVVYYPPFNASSETITYEQYKGTLSNLQFSQVINLNIVAGATVQGFTQELVWDGTPGGNNQNYSLTMEQALYCKVDMLVVAAGGGGGREISNNPGWGGGGGGAARVNNIQFRGISGGKYPHRTRAEVGGASSTNQSGNDSSFVFQSLTGSTITNGTVTSTGGEAGNAAVGSIRSYTGIPLYGVGGGLLYTTSGTLPGQFDEQYFDRVEPFQGYGGGTGGCSTQGGCTRSVSSVTRGIDISNSFRTTTICQGGPSHSVNDGTLPAATFGSGGAGQAVGGASATTGGPGYIWFEVSVG